MLGDGVEESRSLSSRAWEQARLRPGQVHLILLYLGIFSFLVWVNVMMAMGSVPMLAKTFLGIESAASRDSSALFNSTLIVASFALANLCFDPLWKAVYVVRCFHGAARRSGVDLKVQLADLRRLKAVAVAAASWIDLGHCSTGSAVRGGAACQGGADRFNAAGSFHRKRARTARVHLAHAT